MPKKREEAEEVSLKTLTIVFVIGLIIIIGTILINKAVEEEIDEEITKEEIDEEVTDLGIGEVLIEEEVLLYCQQLESRIAETPELCSLFYKNREVFPEKTIDRCEQELMINCIKYIADDLKNYSICEWITEEMLDRALGIWMSNPNVDKVPGLKELNDEFQENPYSALKKEQATCETGEDVHATY
ncbi:MAG: hypothetical protein H8D38_06040 [DPANN group archaeon]|nr:hypothetical protein [DPANN group archaeon]